MSFRFRSRFTRGSLPLHCPPRLSAFIIWRFLPATISLAGSAAFSKKCPRPNSGFFTPPWPELRALLFFSPANSSDISSRRAITRKQRNQGPLFLRANFLADAVCDDRIRKQLAPLPSRAKRYRNRCRKLYVHPHFLRRGRALAHFADSKKVDGLSNGSAFS